MNVETHITCHINDSGTVEQVGTAVNWKFSKIDGDPLLGAKPHCYLTSHSKSVEDALVEMKRVEYILREASVLVLRSKIELIIYDTASGEGVGLKSQVDRMFG